MRGSKKSHFAQSVLWSLLAFLLSCPTTPSRALAGPSFATGDRVLITAQRLLVYLEPDINSPAVSEVNVGNWGNFIKSQPDAQGTIWIYLARGAFGWVQGVVGSMQTLIPYSDSALA